MEMHEIREENLRRIINPQVRGNTARYARENELDAGYLSQIFNGTRTVGEKAARTFEAKAGLPYMSLDIRGGITLPNAESDKVAAAIIADQELTPDDKTTLLQMLATYRSIKLMQINIDYADIPETIPGKPGKTKRK
jgi:hypothetical protein